jgi:hypothetical protein
MHPIRNLSAALIGTAVLLTSIPPALAGFNEQVAISLHISAPVEKNACGLSIHPTQFTSRQPLLSGLDGPFYFVNLFACWGSDSAGIGGIECGISYHGGYSPGGGAFPINVFSWSACSDLEFPSDGWPGPNTGNLMTWTRFNCHHPDSDPGVPRTELAFAGYFYLAAYASDPMSVIPRPVSGRLKVADCLGAEDDLTYPAGDFRPHRAGIAGFGSSQGFNSCNQVTPTRPMTWSGIKTLNGN